MRRTFHAAPDDLPIRNAEGGAVMVPQGWEPAFQDSHTDNPGYISEHVAFPYSETLPAQPDGTFRAGALTFTHDRHGHFEDRRTFHAHGDPPASMQEAQHTAIRLGMEEGWGNPQPDSVHHTTHDTPTYPPFVGVSARHRYEGEAIHPVVAINTQGYAQRGHIDKNDPLTYANIEFAYDAPWHRTIDEACADKNPHDRYDLPFHAASVEALENPHTQHKTVREALATQGILGYAQSHDIPYIDAVRDGLKAGALDYTNPQVAGAFEAEHALQSLSPFLRSDDAQPGHLVQQAAQALKAARHDRALTAREETVQIDALAAQMAKPTPDALAQASQALHAIGQSAQAEGMPRLSSEMLRASGGLGVHARPSPEASAVLAAAMKDNRRAASSRDDIAY